MTPHDRNRLVVASLRAALRSGEADTLRDAPARAFARDAQIRMGYPLGEMTGPEALWDQVHAPLLAALQDPERADLIVMAGPRWGTGHGSDRDGVGGNILGNFRRSWLGIPASGQPVFTPSRRPADQRRPDRRDGRPLGHPPTDDASGRIADGAAAWRGMDVPRPGYGEGRDRGPFRRRGHIDAHPLGDAARSKTGRRADTAVSTSGGSRTGRSARTGSWSTWSTSRGNWASMSLPACTR